MADNEQWESTRPTSSTANAPINDRVTGLERDVVHLYKTVEDTSKELKSQGQRMEAGFQRLNETLAKNHTELHKRIEAQESTFYSNQKPNWTVMLVGIGLVISLVGALVSFVLLTQDPIRLGVTDNRQELRVHLNHAEQFRREVSKNFADAERRTDARVDKLNVSLTAIEGEARALHERVKENTHEIDLLLLENWDRWEKQDASDARLTAEVRNLQMMLQELKDLIKVKTSDRFSGREGELLKERIQQLESRLQWQETRP